VGFNLNIPTNITPFVTHLIPGTLSTQNRAVIETMLTV